MQAGLTPAKDGNAALCYLDHRTLPIFKCVDYSPAPAGGQGIAVVWLSYSRP